MNGTIIRNKINRQSVRFQFQFVTEQKVELEANLAKYQATGKKLMNIEVDLISFKSVAE